MFPPRYRWVGPAAVLSVLLAGLFAIDPIPQSPAYHALADSRSWYGVPNVLNVVSNAAFLYVGVVGLRLCFEPEGPPLRLVWSIFFLGVALVCAGSAYYHWRPDNARLVWDRLPMTVAFMALFAAVIAEHIGESLDRYLLAPAVVVGIASVQWWQYTDDLRPYLWVQAAPLVAVPLLFAFYPSRYGYRRYLLYALGVYLLAKALELYDHEVYRLTWRIVSGHTLKHLVAALSTYLIYRMLRQRALQPAIRAPHTTP